MAVVLLGAVLPMGAATPNEFYTGLLRRGMASYDASRYADAAKQLRFAAFGLVEAIDQYQVAQVYLALAHDKLGETDRAREAARRVALAERIERRFGALTLPASVRSAFDAVATRLLGANDIATLRAAMTNPPPAPQQPQTVTTTPPPRTATTTPAITKPAPQPARTQEITIPRPLTTDAETTPRTTQATKPTPPPVVKPPAATPPRPTETTGRGGPVEPTRPATPPVTPPAPRPITASEANARLASAERALNTANLAEARRVYRELLAQPALERDALIRVAEGLYRARDFAGALNAFTRVGTLRRGEEPYRYYIAVAAYETGDHARAKKELAAALPYIEVTPDVARYRSRIEGSS